MPNAVKPNSLQTLTRIALLIAVEAIMAAGLGFIQVPPISITLMHIPVLVGGVLMGAKVGAILGGAFGVFSIIRAAYAPGGPADILFNPFASGQPIESLIMAVVPRILLGVVVALLFNLLSKRMNIVLATSISAGIATVFHSASVLGLLSVFFDAFPLVEVFYIIIGVNGLLELVAAVILTSAICAAANKSMGRSRK